jgi:hypothetical protein
MAPKPQPEMSEEKDRMSNRPPIPINIPLIGVLAHREDPDNTVSAINQLLGTMKTTQTAITHLRDMLRQKAPEYNEWIRQMLLSSANVFDRARDAVCTVGDLPAKYQTQMKGEFKQALEKSTDLLMRLKGFMDGLEAAIDENQSPTYSPPDNFTS